MVGVACGGRVRPRADQALAAFLAHCGTHTFFLDQGGLPTSGELVWTKSSVSAMSRLWDHDQRRSLRSWANLIVPASWGTTTSFFLIPISFTPTAKRYQKSSPLSTGAEAVTQP